ncbi:Uncharacterised protein [Escherichia coli]|nr:Uncharacterised protein [Escherichia coli]
MRIVQRLREATKVMNRGRRLIAVTPVPRVTSEPKPPLLLAGVAMSSPTSASCGYTNYLPARSSDYRDLKQCWHTC